MNDSFDVEVAVVGGGPAGAAVASHLCAAGREVAVFERLPEPRWRACGVYSSPLTRRRLRDLGLTAEQLDRLITPLTRMVVETADGSAGCALEYPGSASACGVDRVRLESALLELIRGAGARVYEGAVVRSVELGSRRSRLRVSQPTGASTWTAHVVVGADGPASLVARAAGVNRSGRFFRRAAITGHRAVKSRDAGMIVGNGWYLGLAAVPGERVNLGLVLADAELRRRLANQRPGEVVSEFASRTERARHLASAPPTDAAATHVPLLHRVTRSAGEGWLLVGDACGFVDPVSGEGLHRALVSAEFAARAIDLHLAGDHRAMQDYDRHLRARFLGKDVMSWLLQLFVLQPALARRGLDRLARNEDLRNRLAAAMGDLAPATTVLDPRFIARILA